MSFVFISGIFADNEWYAYDGDEKNIKMWKFKIKWVEFLLKVVAHKLKKIYYEIVWKLIFSWVFLVFNRMIV